MATSFLMKNKRTWMVFLRSTREGRKVLIRQRFNIVQYGTDPNAETFIEGLHDPVMRLLADPTSDIKDVEIFEEKIKIFDQLPSYGRHLGGAAGIPETR